MARCHLRSPRGRLFCFIRWQERRHLNDCKVWMVGLGIGRCPWEQQALVHTMYLILHKLLRWSRVRSRNTKSMQYQEVYHEDYSGRSQCSLVFVCVLLGVSDETLYNPSAANKNALLALMSKVSNMLPCITGGYHPCIPGGYHPSSHNSTSTRTRHIIYPFSSCSVLDRPFSQ